MTGWHPTTPAVPSPEWLDQSPPAPLVIHVWAEWNGIDREMDRLINAWKMPVPVFSLDTDDERFWPFLVNHEVTNVPALLVFRGAGHTKTIQNRGPAILLGMAAAELHVAVV